MPKIPQRVGKINEDIMRPRNESLNVGDAVELHGKELKIMNEDGVGINSDGNCSVYDFQSGNVINQSQHPIDPRVLIRKEEIAKHTSPSINSEFMED